MFDPPVFLLDCQHIEELRSSLGSRQGSKEIAQSVPRTVSSNGGWHGPEYRHGHCLAGGLENPPLQPVMYPWILDRTGESDDLDNMSGQVRDGQSWVKTEKGAGRKRERRRGRKERGKGKKLD